MKTIPVFHVLALSMLCLIQFGCGGVVPFAGPIDHPKFEMKNWKELNMKYWVVTSTTNATKWEETERILHISGTDIDGLRKVFITKSSKGTAQGSVRPWVLRIDPNDEWYFELTSPNTCFFCEASNVEHAYFVTISSTDFYSQLREKCFENERRITPDIVIDNIRICRRFGGKEPPQEKVLAYTGKAFSLLSLPLSVPTHGLRDDAKTPEMEPDSRENSPENQTETKIEATKMSSDE